MNAGRTKFKSYKLRLIMQLIKIKWHYNIQVPLVDSYTAIIIEPIAAIKLLIKILHYSILELTHFWFIEPKLSAYSPLEIDDYNL